MIVKLLIDGGNMKPGPAIAQQLGPMGINMGKVISDVNAATKEFKGIQVPVHLDVDPKTKNFTVKVLSPPVSQLIKKELALELASGDRMKLIVGNIALEQLISVTKVKHPTMLAKTFLSALKSVIGSCMSMGILIDSKDPKEVLKDITDGKYKNEIDNQISEVPVEKKKQLDEFFANIKTKQEEAKKKEEEAKAAEEAAKAAEATAKAPAPGTPAAATPAAATPAATKEAKPAKPEAKKK